MVFCAVPDSGLVERKAGGIGYVNAAKTGTILNTGDAATSERRP
jgi:hypothetical protein